MGTWNKKSEWISKIETALLWEMQYVLFLAQMLKKRKSEQFTHNLYSNTCLTFATRCLKCKIFLSHANLSHAQPQQKITTA